MKAIYFDAKKEIVATYENVANLSYAVPEDGQPRDTIIIRGHIDGNPIAQPIAFIRLKKGERVEYQHEYVQDKSK